MAIPVDIRLLGSVEISGEAGTVPLAGPRLRTLAGLLALRAPNVVSRDTLIEGIWDTEAPAKAVKTLRAYIAYLRRSLVAGGIGGLIATRSPGYALAAPPECVDAHRFEELVGKGRAASAAGALDSTVNHLRTALGLWRGEVLAGCAQGEWVRAEVTRLQEVQLSATEELIAAELALGRHSGVVAELEALVLRYPLRERLWELLMRALYLAGRQSDALDAYRRARSRLVDEIGIDPGAELQRLEAAILAGDPELTVPIPTAVVLKTAVNIPIEQPGIAEAIPAPLTNLVGRLAEIAELSGLLAERRLVTLTGVGGCGKTRLAIAVAGQVAGRYADGVRFVDLSPLADANLVPATIAAGLSVAADPDGGIIGPLTRYLRPQRCLLVLDNCEHVVQSCAQLVTTLLRCCPNLRVLATSRETLGVLGEVAWPVPSLATPPVSGVSGGLAEVSRYDAVQLFLERATVAATRGLTDADAPALAALCAGLDGLPLAIELAAARTSVLTVTEIADRLHDSTLLHSSLLLPLPNHHPDRPHHHALDATVAWSYDLLDATTQSRFCRLAVFAGGFTLAAAAAVWPGVDERTAVGVLADLVAKSLVVMERQPNGARYRLLQTIGRWAADRLAEDPDAERDARQRHAAYYLAFAENADQQLRRAEVGSWLERLAAEHENLRAALSWFDCDQAAQLRLAVALARYCELRGRYSEGRRWLAKALAGDPAAAGAPATTVGRALAAAARFAFLVCDYRDAEVQAVRALAVHRQADDEAGTTATLRLLACVARERGDYSRSLTYLDEAMARPCSDAAAIADLLQQIGFTCWLAGDLDRAERPLTAALAGYHRLSDIENVASTRIHLAAVAFYRGQLDLAGRLAANALAHCTKLDAKAGVAWALNIIGLVALTHGRFAQAAVTLRASLEMHCAVGDRWRQASVLEALAAACVATGDPMRAAELLGLAAALRDAIEATVPAQERAALEHTYTMLRDLLPGRTLRATFARGASMRVPDVITSSWHENRLV